jgi:hypothetical protein
VSSRFAKAMLTRSVRKSAGKAGLPGFLAGAAFNMLVRRSPMGALTVGAAILVHRAYRAGRDAKAKRGTTPPPAKP